MSGGVWLRSLCKADVAMQKGRGSKCPNYLGCDHPARIGRTLLDDPIGGKTQSHYEHPPNCIISNRRCAFGGAFIYGIRDVARYVTTVERTDFERAH